MLWSFLSRYRAWIFPGVLVVLLTVLTGLKLSGSSVGMFNQYLYGEDHRRNVLLNEPRTIRSDEWELNTPMTVSQERNGFPRINEDIGNGQDMSVVLDVPYKEWSAAFKPQNWAFFVLPLEYAFAFKWWLLGVALMLSCYLFCLQLMPKKYLIASLISVSLFLSPFVQWWYQTITVAPLIYSLLTCVLVLRLLDKSYSNKQALGLAALLAYVLTAFGMVLYLPFLLPCMMVASAFLAGHIANHFSRKERTFFARRILYGAGAAVLAVLIVGIFLKTRSDVISTLGNTVYPGHRVVESGGSTAQQLLGGYFNRQLQYDDRAAFLPLNQSEASSFILVFPFLLPALVLLDRKKKKRPDWILVFLAGLFCVFLLYLFVPQAGLLAKVLLLDRIPHNRLTIGIGLTNVLVLAIAIQKLLQSKVELSRRVQRASGLAAFLLVSFVGGLLSAGAYKGYVTSQLKILVVGAVIGGIVWLLLKRQFVPALTLLVIFSGLSTFRIHPLYRGLDPLVGSSLSKEIQAIGRADPGNGWVVAEPGTFENIAIASGLRSLSGAYAYPQLDIWEPLKKLPQDQDTYNRFAHVFFTINDTLDPNQSYLDPPALDAFRANTSPCSDFLKQHRITYILTTMDHQATCLTKVKDIPYPKAPFKVYQINQNP